MNYEQQAEECQKRADTLVTHLLKIAKNCVICENKNRPEVKELFPD